MHYCIGTLICMTCITAGVMWMKLRMLALALNRVMKS